MDNCHVCLINTTDCICNSDLKTARNKRGDVCTYVFHDEKHTLFTFNAESGVSRVETLQRTDYLDGWAYMRVSAGGRSSAILPAEYGRYEAEYWADTQTYVDGLNA